MDTFNVCVGRPTNGRLPYRGGLAFSTVHTLQSVGVGNGVVQKYLAVRQLAQSKKVPSKYEPSTNQVSTKYQSTDNQVPTKYQLSTSEQGMQWCKTIQHAAPSRAKRFVCNSPQNSLLRSAAAAPQTLENIPTSSHSSLRNIKALLLSQTSCVPRISSEICAT